MVIQSRINRWQKNYGNGCLSQKKRLLESEKTGCPLRVYCGYDPRTSDLHIGHTVTMRKLRQFQELGHHVIFVIGTFTALIGDPSDKDKLRTQLSPEDLMQNKLFVFLTVIAPRYASTMSGSQN